MDPNYLKVRFDLRQRIYSVLANAEKRPRKVCTDCGTSKDVLACNTARYNMFRCRGCVVKGLIEDYSNTFKSLDESQNLLKGLEFSPSD